MEKKKYVLDDKKADYNISMGRYFRESFANCHLIFIYIFI